MPELPEVETIKNEIAAAVVGAKILKVDILKRSLREKIADDTESKIEGSSIVACKRIDTQQTKARQCRSAGKASCLLNAVNA